MYAATRRCTVVYGSEITPFEIEHALADVSALFANGFVMDHLATASTNWTSFPVRGPSRRMGGDHKLAEQVRRRVSQYGASVGVADTEFVALLAARSAPSGVRVIEPNKGASFLSRVPLRITSQLGVVPADVIDALLNLGYRTLGMVAEIDQTLLRDRFGTSGVLLWHLCNGNEVSPAIFREPGEEAIHECCFDEPLQVSEQVLFAVRATVDEIVAMLATQSLLCTQFGLYFETEHAEVCEKVWNYSIGFNAKAMLERVRWQLDEWLHANSSTSTITAGIVSARFNVFTTRPANSEQLTLWGDHSGTDTDASRLVGKLSTAFGANSVSMAQWRGGRCVADTFTTMPALDVDLLDSELIVRTQNPSRHEGPWRGVLPEPSPTVIVDPPIEAALMDANGQLVGVTRRCELTSIPATLNLPSSGMVDVLTWAGPWPIEERWWSPNFARRMVQMQVVCLRSDGSENAVLLTFNNGQWQLAAYYR